MKTLILVRHAKAIRGDPSLPDIERSLDDRGRHDAARMGERLAERGVRPDLIVSSPALRARTTAQLMADPIGHPQQAIVIEDSLYASSVRNLLAIVHALDDRLDSVMLFGHNPEFADLARRLSGIDDMPTCAVAEFRFDTQAWADVGEIDPVQATLDTPKG